MRNINKVILIGNVTRDPEIKKMTNGETIATFGLATNREWVSSNGAEQRSTEFHEVVCFGGLAHVSEMRVRKGMLVNIVGYVKTRSWDDNEGLKRFRTEVIAEELIVLTRSTHPGTGPREESAASAPIEMNPMNEIVQSTEYSVQKP